MSSTKMHAMQTALRWMFYALHVSLLILPALVLWLDQSGCLDTGQGCSDIARLACT